MRGGMTQTAFGALLGVTNPAVHYWEKGRFKPRRSALKLMRLIKADRTGRVLRMLKEMAFDGREDVQ